MTTAVKQPSRSLRYPVDLTIDSDTDFIQFDFFTYNPPFNRVGSGLNKGNSGGDAITGGVLGGPLPNTQKKAPSAGLGYDQIKKNIEGLEGDNQIAGNFGKRAKAKNWETGNVEYIPSIQLFMPQDVSTSYASQWGGKEFGSGAAGIMNALAGRPVNAWLEGVKSLPAGMEGLKTDLLSKMLSGANQSITQDDVLGGTSDVIKNPNVELLFGGPQIRNIGFKFKMSATSKAEAMDIHSICHIFKMESLASMGNAAGDGQNATGWSAYTNFIKVPDLVRMQMMNGSKLHPYLTQYKALALTLSLIHI